MILAARQRRQNGSVRLTKGHVAGETEYEEFCSWGICRYEENNERERKRTSEISEHKVSHSRLSSCHASVSPSFRRKRLFGSNTGIASQQPISPYKRWRQHSQSRRVTKIVSLSTSCCCYTTIITAAAVTSVATAGAAFSLPAVAIADEEVKVNYSERSIRGAARRWQNFSLGVGGVLCVRTWNKGKPESAGNCWAKTTRGSFSLSL